MGLVIGVDGGNSKTTLVAARTDGKVLAYTRGPGTNSHAVGAEGVAEVIATLVTEAKLKEQAEHGVFFLCGADLPSDIAELEQAIFPRGWARELTVENDTFALLRAGTDATEAIAVICGSGINVIGRAADGTVARYPSLGWETGDWGGAEMLGREVLRLSARAEDGRGDATALVEVVRSHFGTKTVEEVGIAVHYKQMPVSRLGELGPKVIAAAADGDVIARSLLDLLADEIVLIAQRALRDLGVSEAAVVLGGGMLHGGEGLLYSTVVERLPPSLHPVPAVDEPVVGSALAALDAAGADDKAKARLRAELRGR